MTLGITVGFLSYSSGVVVMSEGVLMSRCLTLRS